MSAIIILAVAVFGKKIFKSNNIRKICNNKSIITNLPNLSASFLSLFVELLCYKKLLIFYIINMRIKPYKGVVF